MVTVEVFTDGACRGNPGPGGWGAILTSGDHRKEISGAEAHTTNNRMEMRAAIEALKSLRAPSAVVLHTDSEYLRRGITEWLPAWKRRGWRTASGSPVRNADLWRDLEQAAAPHRVDWRWVRGHSGHPGNERADQLAREAIDRGAGVNASKAAGL